MGAGANVNDRGVVKSTIGQSLTRPRLGGACPADDLARLVGGRTGWLGKAQAGLRSWSRRWHQRASR
jgi:hypothetical protein